MTINPVTEGHIPFEIPSVKRECFTYYKIIGELTPDSIPLICIHGGPGAGHEYLAPFGRLWSDKKIPVILYDQIGCASSTHLRDTIGDESLWQASLMVDEFWNLVKYFKLERYDILGHSWGGALASLVAVQKPPGLRRMLLFSALVDSRLQDKFMRKLVYGLPERFRDVFVKQFEDKEYDKDDYQAAMEYFFKKYAYRDEPFPGEELGRSLANFADDMTVSDTMGGTKWMGGEGTLKDLTLIPVLGDIEVPVLLIDGEFDYVFVEPYFTGLTKVKWATIAGACHMCFLENAGRENVFDLVRSFLTSESE